MASLDPSWHFDRAAAPWVRVALVVPALVLIVGLLLPREPVVYVGPEPELWPIECGPDGLWFGPCRRHLVEVLQDMPDPLTMPIWADVLMVLAPRERSDPLLGAAPIEPTPGLWEVALAGSPPPTLSKDDWAWANALRLLALDVFGPESTMPDPERLKASLEVAFAAKGAPGQRSWDEAVAAGRVIEARWTRIAAVEVAAAARRLEAAPAEARAAWEARRATAVRAAELRSAQGRQKGWLGLGLAGWAMVAGLSTLVPRRSLTVKVRPDRLEIGERGFDAVDVLGVQAYEGRLVVLLRSAAPWRSPRLRDARAAAGDLEPALRELIRDEATARAELAERDRMRAALADLRDV